MNEAERSELELLKQRQESLSRQLAFLAKSIEGLESRLRLKTAEQPTSAPPATEPKPIQPTAQTASPSRPSGAMAQTSAAEKLLANRQEHRETQKPNAAVPPLIPPKITPQPSKPI